jgi:hypothetical protein
MYDTIHIPVIIAVFIFQYDSCEETSLCFEYRYITRKITRPQQSSFLQIDLPTLKLGEVTSVPREMPGRNRKLERQVATLLETINWSQS